ncbi:transglutaminase-like domain-containing protein [Corallococcus terminator]|uniref:Transglutaminase domain-containing protein n=1 Tax=Corallococcus terminator TaxID=2316733 RepID=A0A3A8JJ65_9BACT|nr:transglutaminase-like domain-containing protein [Corallococcus terminator]RKG90531.1 transglutaminase domain-containing protein [Corallococcus terminator]
MALAPLSRPSVSSSFTQRPSGVAQGCGGAGQQVVVKVVNGSGAPRQEQGAGTLPPELSSLLRQLGVSPKDIQGLTDSLGGSKQVAPRQFQQSYHRDSFEPSKGQGRSAQKAQPVPQNTPAVQQQKTLAPQGTASTPTQDAKGPASGKGAEQVAQDIAREATSWKYDYTGGKSWQSAMDNAANFDTSKAGVCVDMAIEAEQRFEKEGVEAHVVFGKTAEGGHAWVEFKGDDGKWQAFDPTAAACTKKADDAITPYEGGPYHYQGVDETHEAVA